MGKSSKYFAFLLALAIILSIAVFASADTTYQLRVYAGDPVVGSFGTAYLQDTGCIYGSSHTFNLNGLTVSSKYYAKGIREAGKDYKNVGMNEAPSYIASSGGYVSVTAVRDQDYVVVYGINGAQVEYTIICRYGSTELGRVTYYGDVGDRPMIALPYFDGYVPPATYGQTPSALSSDPSQNVFYVTYTRATTTTTVIGGGGNGGGGNAGGGNAGGNANAGNNANAGDNANTDNGGVAAAPNNNVSVPAQGLNELEYFDENQTPLADFDDLFGTDSGSETNAGVPQVVAPTVKQGLPRWLIILLIVLGVVLIGLLYWYLLFYRKKKKYAGLEEEDYDFSFLDNSDDDFFDTK